MRRLTTTAICAGALLIGGLTLRAAEKNDKTTVEGELIDMYCFSAGGAKGADHASCAKGCAASGIPMGVLVDGKAWTLVTNPIPLSEYAAKTVRVTGDVNKETQAVLPDKVEVKDGDTWKEVKLSDEHHK